VQVGVPTAAVGDPLDGHRTKDRRQATGVAGLGAATRGLTGVDDLAQPHLPLRPQVQVILQQLAEQPPAVLLKPLLQLGMRYPRRLRARQPGHHRFEASTRAAKRPFAGLHRVRFHQGSFSTFWFQHPRT